MSGCHWGWGAEVELRPHQRRALRIAPLPASCSPWSSKFGDAGNRPATGAAVDAK